MSLSTRHGRLVTSAASAHRAYRRPPVTSRSLSLLTFLHKTITFAPAVLRHTSLPDTSNITQSSDFWTQNLTRIYDDLNSTTDRPARIVVYGLDQWSGARDLVNALLDEPFTSDPSLSRALADRWKEQPQPKITLSLSSPVASASSHISLPSSSYLAQFSVPVDIVEIASPPNTQSPFSALDDASVAQLFQADVPIVVFNPISTPLSVLRDAHLPSNTILIITSSPSALAPDYLHNLALSRNGCPSALSSNWKLIVADPKRAVDAIHALKANPNSPTAVQRYQDGFLGSGISSVTAALKASLDFVNSSELSTSQSIAALRRRTALASLRDALSICSMSIERAKEDTNALRRRVSHLNDRVEGLKITAETDILGMKERSSVGDSVKEALEKARKDMKMLMDRLTWWKVLWRIDEIGTMVSSEVQRVWCPDLEKKLILKTGKLSVIQQELSKSSFSLLSSSPPPYNSAILRNKLLQFQSSPSHHLTPQSLTHPLYSRRSQITEYPTTRLHLAGQRIVMAMSGGIAAGAGVGWSGWLGWFMGTGEGLFGVVGMEPTTAVGVGMLGAIVSMRWAVGRWESAKKKWWADWTRVGEGLDRDLRTTVHQVVSENVVVVPDSACKGLFEMTSTRKEEMATVQEKMEKMSAELQAINERP